MKTLKFALGFTFALVPFALLADTGVPEVSGVTYSQNKPGSRIVTIHYTLANAPGIITLDVLTNGVSIGDANINHLLGDVNTLITNNGTHTITWLADKSWPGNKITNNIVQMEISAWATNASPDYMVADLINGNVSYYTSADALPRGGITNLLYKTDWLVMRKIPAAGVPWDMGSTASELGHQAEETNQPVTLPSDYYMGVFQVTQAQWYNLTGAQPSSFKSFYSQYPGRPVECISYQMVREGVNGTNTANSNYWYPNDPNPDSVLGKMRKMTGLPFDLPSEAQWEYACRAGTTQGHWNDGSAILSSGGTDTNLGRLARYCKNGGQYSGNTVSPTGGTAVVGSYLPNAWGLYDMHGNLWEWCLDWYEALHVYPNHDGAVNTNRPPDSLRVFRGATWYNNPADCRSARRGYRVPSTTHNGTGVRFACGISPQ